MQIVRSKQNSGAASYVPAGADLDQLREAAQKCRGCELYRNATQAVLGEGPSSARLVMIGEQPGDKEDLAGRPFVGPAGGLLNRALQDAGIDRANVYLTNVVKHFKFEERGKRRIHKKPTGTEIAACHPWLEAELACVHPEIVVCLGASAAQGVIGKQHRVLEARGRFFETALARQVTATVHPSSILRAPDREERRRSYEAFVSDLKRVQQRLSKVRKAH